MFSFGFFAFFTIFSAFIDEKCVAEPALRTCEPIRVGMCMGLGYDMTGMPNLGGNDVQQEADFNLKSFGPLIQYGCSQHLKLFLCSVYVPMCTEKVANPIGPCRGLCENVRSRCYPILEGFGFPWPDALNCSRFPTENNHEHMCMEGPKDKIDVRAPVNPAVRKFNCGPQSIRNGVIGCGPTNCGGNGLFNDAEKKIAEVWITVCALACLVASLGTVLTLTIGGGRVHAPPLVSLAVCYVFVGAGWTLRSFAGRSGVTCGTTELIGASNEEGLPNVICAFVFLLLYYFGMAANSCWVCLCAWWLARAGLSWSPDRMRGLTSALHICAWGFPAAQTVAALIRRDVDSDELTGTCYIGNKNLLTLLYLVLVPYLLYFCLGALILTWGWILVIRRPKTASINSVSAPLTQGPPRKERDFLGALATLYAVPMFCVMASYLYEYNNRENWLSEEQKPSLWFFLILRYFMSLFIGISSVFWIWSSKSAQVWRSALKRLGPRSQPSKSAPVLRYPLTHHQGLIVPGSLNNVVRQSTRVHSHRKTPRSHHLRSGSETII